MTNPSRNLEIESRIGEMLDDKLTRRHKGPYRALSDAAVMEKLSRLLRAHVGPNFQIESIGRLAGGASKEQFLFTSRIGTRVEKLVLRMDPLEGVVETCRFREAELLRAMQGRLPVPEVRFLDGDGTYLGQPGVVTSFLNGVTKPPVQNKIVVSGVGTSFTSEWRARLAPQFVQNLVIIHQFDWGAAALPHFEAPSAGTTQAALWQVNWWSRVWNEDHIDTYPLLTMAEHWLREHLPACDEPVLVHGDYRTGNFMFDADSGEFTAILDWELAHIGDFHEELAWTIQRLFAGEPEKGKSHVCGLMTREDFLTEYEAATSRRVNERTLGFYEILGAYKCATQLLGSSLAAASRQNNHQDLLLTWLVPLGHTFLGEIVRLIKEQKSHDA
ncbi:MAG: phosphotransferase family protein [Steroidobacteraceae bacterium]